MESPLAERPLGVTGALKAAAVATYMVGVATYLRVTRRIRPRRSLVGLAASTAALAARRGVASLVHAPLSGTLEGFVPHEGHAHVARLPLVNPFVSDADGTSTLEVFEDGRPLGPPHAVHDDIATIGRGAFSHWHNVVVLSSSDNTDPRTNGRRYTYSGRP